MNLYLVSNNNSDIFKSVGKRYQRDYDILQIKKKIELRIKIDELIEIEKNLTLLDEINSKPKQDLKYNDFIESLRLKRKLKYGY